MTELVARITAYLSGGGLVNPELADHLAVRDLLTDCRAALMQRGEQASQLAEKAIRVTNTEFTDSIYRSCR